jgi:hypothetical protein
MKTKEIEVTTKQTVYELTEEELKNLKKEYALKGANCCANYIWQYLSDRYKQKPVDDWVKEFKYIMESYKSVVHFCKKDTSYLSNNNYLSMSIFDFLNNEIQY